MKRKKTKSAFSILLVLAILALGAFYAWRAVYDHVLYPVKYEEIITEYSEYYNVDKALVCSVVNVESRFNSNALSKAGAMGLMQLTGETFEWLQELDGISDPLDDSHLFDPEINIKYGVMLLSLNLKDYADTDTALACYNAGRGAVDRWLKDPAYSDDGRTLTAIPYPETEKFVKKVKAGYEIYGRKTE